MDLVARYLEDEDETKTNPTSPTGMRTVSPLSLIGVADWGRSAGADPGDPGSGKGVTH